MNYFALAGAIITGLIAFRSLAVIVWVSVDHRAKWDSPYGFYVNALIVTLAGTASASLFSEVA